MNRWYIPQAFSMNQCKPLDLVCKFRSFVETYWGIDKGNNTNCYFSEIYISPNNEKYMRATCMDKNGTKISCPSIKYPVASTKCKIECANKGLVSSNQFCNTDDLICICK